LSAQAVSRTCPRRDDAPRAITRIRVTNLLQVVGRRSDGPDRHVVLLQHGRLCLGFYQSFTGSAIVNGPASIGTKFQAFRDRTPLEGGPDGAGRRRRRIESVPRIDEIDLEYAYVEQREYARASAAATVVTQAGGAKKLVIGASFIFPRTRASFGPTT